MRIGINPEKLNFKKIQYKLHRVIIPVFVPNDESDYFKNSDAVFYASINSLLKTVDSEKTNVTIINNNSKKEVTEFIDDLLDKKLIDKHVKFKENYGKVFTILQEARASYEDFITIADADVFFFTNWQNEVHQIFDIFKRVGVVGLTPDPHMAFYCNNSLLFNSFFSIKKGKIVEDYDLELFEEGINNKDFFISKNHNWKEKQYYLEKDGQRVVIGASHFASTYRKEIFNQLKFEKPENVFPGGELSFLDSPIDKLGYYRLSLIKAFVYHMGNNLDILSEIYLEKREINIRKKNYKRKRKDFDLVFKLKEIWARIFKKLSRL